MFEPKWPGFSALLVLGLGIGALLKNDAITAVICFAVVALDCIRYVKN